MTWSSASVLRISTSGFFFEDDQIGIFARREAADLVLAADRLGRADRRRAQDFVRRHAAGRIRLHFPMNPESRHFAVRADAEQSAGALHLGRVARDRGVEIFVGRVPVPAREFLLGQQRWRKVREFRVVLRLVAFDEIVLRRWSAVRNLQVSV
jgi:hypothetical protein